MKMIFAKHFLVEDGPPETQEVQKTPGNFETVIKPGTQHFIKSAACSSICYYCTSKGHCKSCVTGGFLQMGARIPTSIPSSYTEDACVDGTQTSMGPTSSPTLYTLVKDSCERDYKAIAETGTNSMFTCKNPKCLICSDQAHETCTSCIDYAYSDPSSICAGDCPSGMIRFGNNAGTPCTKCIPSICTNCCEECESTTSCKTCKKGYTRYIHSGTNYGCSTDVCGDGIKSSIEDCDDGNKVSGDGCSSTCKIELNFECTTPNAYAQSVCNPKCNDGIFLGMGTEKCDVAIGSKGCVNCKIEPGWWCISHIGAASVCYDSPEAVYSLNSFYNGDYNILLFEFTKNLISNPDELCYRLFGKSVSLFGSGYRCEITRSNVLVYLGEDNEIYSGTIVSTAAGAIRAASETTPFPYNLNFTTSKIDPQIVKATAVVPTSILSCETMHIVVNILQGGLKRPFREISFTVIEIKKNVNVNTEEIISNMQMVTWKLSNSKKIDLEMYTIDLPENSFLYDATYKIRLNVINFQGDMLSSSQIYTFTTSKNIRAIATLQGVVEDKVNMFYRYQDIVVVTIPRLYECKTNTNIDTTVTVSYKEVNNKYIVQNNAFRTLYIPGNTLNFGITYSFEATLIVGTIINIVKKFSIKIERSPIVIYTTPFLQLLGRDTNFNISAEGSYDCIFPINKIDEHAAYDNKRGLTYLWECPPLSPVLRSTSKVLSANSNSLLSLGYNTKIPCGLTVFNMSDGKANSTEAYIVLANANSLSISLEGPKDIVQPNDTIFVYALISEMNTAVQQVEWEISNCHLIFPNTLWGSDDQACSLNILTEVNKHYVRLDLSKVDSDGKSFDIVMKVKDLVDNTNPPATQSITIKVDSVPKAGTFIVSPTDGKAWLTNFTLTAENFRNPNGNVYYQFFYRHINEDFYTPINIKDVYYSAVTQLPVGLPSNNFIIEIMVRAYNDKGGYIQLNETVKCSDPSDKTLMIPDTYKQLKAKADSTNLKTVVEAALIGTLMLSPISDDALDESIKKVCNGHGKWIQKKCVCEIYYEQRDDCSIYDIDFYNEMNLAALILTDLAKVVKFQPSSEINRTIAQVVVNIASKYDLLDENTKSLARDLLYSTLTYDTSIDVNQLMAAIDAVAMLPTDAGYKDKTLYKKQTEMDYNKIYEMLDLVITKELKSMSTIQKVKHDLKNVKAESFVFTSTSTDSVNNSVIWIQSVQPLMKQSKGHIILSMIEWKTPLYTWTSQYPVVKTNIISLYAKDSQGKEMVITNLVMPISITFPLDIDSNSAAELTNIRCMSYNKVKFNIESMELSLIDPEYKLGICLTYHLTDFAMVIPTDGSMIFPTQPGENPNIVITEETYKQYILYNSALFWFTIAVSIVFCYLILWGYFKEKSENELIGLMKSKAYTSQKDLFQDKSSSGLVSMADASQASDRSQSEIKPSESPEKELQNISGASSMSSARENELKVGSIEREKEGTFRKGSLGSAGRADIVKIPEENKDDSYDVVAEPIRSAEGTAKSKKRKRKIKRKVKKSKKVNKEEEEKVEDVNSDLDTEYNKAKSIEQIEKTDEPLQPSNSMKSQDNSALALVLSNTTQASSGNGFCYILLVIFLLIS